MKTANGLEGVIATETSLSNVDGEAGRLIVRDRDIEHWVATQTFDSFAHHMWAGLVEGLPKESEMAGALGEARVALFPYVEARLAHTNDLSTIEGLRFMAAGLPDDDRVPTPLRLAALMPIAAANIIRQQKGQVPVAPNADHSTAEDFLTMCFDKPPSVVEREALDRYLVTVADHGMNASTFAARVVASTNAGVVSAIVGGLCALKGPLHGGAPGPVLDLLDELAGKENIAEALKAKVQKGERLMGFGHRVYRVRDPRAEILKETVATLPKTSGRLKEAMNMEAEIVSFLKTWKPDRPIQTNVEFYTAILLEALDLPRESFVSVFGIGRTLGWTAHAIEQEKHGRLMRPRSRYIGPREEAA